MQPACLDILDLDQKAQPAGVVIINLPSVSLIGLEINTRSVDQDGQCLASRRLHCSQDATPKRAKMGMTLNKGAVATDTSGCFSSGIMFAADHSPSAYHRVSFNPFYHGVSALGQPSLCELPHSFPFCSLQAGSHSPSACFRVGISCPRLYCYSWSVLLVSWFRNAITASWAEIETTKPMRSQFQDIDIGAFLAIDTTLPRRSLCFCGFVLPTISTPRSSN